MDIFTHSFRLWWQPPRRAGDRIEHRQVTFLELFYDLRTVSLSLRVSTSPSAAISPFCKI